MQRPDEQHRQQVRPGEWDSIARSMREPQFHEQIALYKRREGLVLVSAWAPGA